MTGKKLFCKLGYVKCEINIFSFENQTIDKYRQHQLVASTSLTHQINSLILERGLRESIFVPTV